MQSYIIPGLKVRKSEIEGRGVFIDAKVEEGDLLEKAPVVPYETSPREPHEWDSANILMSKYHGFGNWFNEDRFSVMALGYACFYNHSSEPNVKIVKNLKDLTISFIAIKNIDYGEECLIDYSQEV
jgi:SET domain-containing protein